MNATKKSAVRRDFIIPDGLWAELEPLLPKHKTNHPLGCHRPRVPDRTAMNGIFFVLKTGCQWNALNETSICSSSTAHRRFQEWVKAGVFKKLWRKSLERYDELVGIDWRFLAMDGAMTKAPLGGEKKRPQPDRSGKTRRKTEFAH
jgi:transposase